MSVCLSHHQSAGDETCTYLAFNDLWLSWLWSGPFYKLLKLIFFTVWEFLYTYGGWENREWHAPWCSVDQRTPGGGGFLLLCGSWRSNWVIPLVGNCLHLLSYFNSPSVLNFKNMLKPSIIYFERQRVKASNFPKWSVLKLSIERFFLPGLKRQLYLFQVVTCTAVSTFLLPVGLVPID